MIPSNNIWNAVQNLLKNKQLIGNTETNNNDQSSTSIRDIGHTNRFGQDLKNKILSGNGGGGFTPKSAMERDSIRNKYEKEGHNSVDVGSIINGVASFLPSAYDAFHYSKSVDDLLSEAGTGYSQINGINYQRQNSIGNAESKRVKGDFLGSTLRTGAAGAAAGTPLGPLGAAIGFGVGSIVGGVGNLVQQKKSKEIEDNANYLSANITRVNQYDAMGQGMRQDEYEIYGRPESQVLHAAEGKDQGRFKMGNGMRLTQTNNGFQFAPHNAYGKGGEVIGNPDAGQWDIIKGDKQDNKPLHVEDNDVVITDKFGLAEAAIPSVIASKQLSETINYLQLKANSQKGESAKNVANNVIKKNIINLQQQKDIHDQKLANITEVQKNLRRGGFLQQEQPRLPHAWDGLEWGNFANGALGAITGIAQYIGANKQKVKRPSTYMPNTYGSRALEVADNLRVDTKPIIDQINRESAAGRYRTMTAGGLSGAQRYLANVANILNTQTAKSDALFKADLQNNQYRSNYAQMLAQLGAQDATARMQTNQWDLDYYSKAHAARQQGMQMGVYNLLNSLQQYTANANKYSMFKDMYGLYAATLTNEQRKVLAELNKMKG